MRLLCVLFAVLLLFSMAAPALSMVSEISVSDPNSSNSYGQVLKYCPKMGYCSTKCSKMEKWARSSDCKGHCCLPDNWKWK
ncbi:hypothetical protein ASZ78_001723 [Callipepla squamata]|uniref:Beta-defensin n=1 Tax=Callipepla squamata TaxID=9009 RepID=A0A226N3P7_CALSU|nr:hypothetical protein ASZ78_001723 [Callipepla squamata]